MHKYTHIHTHYTCIHKHIYTYITCIEDKQHICTLTYNMHTAHTYACAHTHTYTYTHALHTQTYTHRLHISHRCEHIYAQHLHMCTHITLIHSLLLV